MASPSRSLRLLSRRAALLRQAAPNAAHRPSPLSPWVHQPKQCRYASDDTHSGKPPSPIVDDDDDDKPASYLDYLLREGVRKTLSDAEKAEENQKPSEATPQQKPNDGLDGMGGRRVVDGELITDREAREKIRHFIERMQRSIPEDDEDDDTEETKQALANDGEALAMDDGPPEKAEDVIDEEIETDFDSDDLSTPGHAELEQMRELREFNRVVAWDMPLLWNQRVPFSAPDEAQTPLRWRYTTYMGEVHPASKKVVVDFAPDKLGDLSEAQVSKMIKLLGPRFDPLTNRAKMSSGRFPTVAQNKRFLGDMVDKLMAEAKDPKDMFEDVPFDFRASRHVEKKRREKLQRRPFPEEWKMSEQRRKELDAKRTAEAQRETQRVLSGQVVDGVRVIAQTMVAERLEQRQRQPVMERVRR